MKFITATFVALSALGLCAASPASAAGDAFVGKWKLNPARSKFSGLTYKIEDAGANACRFAFGDDVETIPLDGKDHPTKYGDTWAIASTGPNTWTSTQKRNGKVTNSSTWKISADGRKFTSSDENRRPDGFSSRDEMTFKRTGGKSGLAGTWVSTGLTMSSPGSFELAPWKGDGYSLMRAAMQERADLKLDGKEYKDKGPRVAKGSTLSGKRVNDHQMELTSKLKGKATQTEDYVVSKDGKTLTDTITYPGVSKAEVDVYDRQ